MTLILVGDIEKILNFYFYTFLLGLVNFALEDAPPRGALLSKLLQWKRGCQFY